MVVDGSVVVVVGSVVVGWIVVTPFADLRRVGVVVVPVEQEHEEHDHRDEHDQRGHLEDPGDRSAGDLVGRRRGIGVQLVEQLALLVGHLHRAGLDEPGGSSSASASSAGVLDVLVRRSIGPARPRRPASTSSARLVGLGLVGLGLVDSASSGSGSASSSLVGLGLVVGSASAAASTSGATTTTCSSSARFATAQGSPASSSSDDLVDAGEVTVGAEHGRLARGQHAARPGRVDEEGLARGHEEQAVAALAGVDHDRAAGHERARSRRG